MRQKSEVGKRGEQLAAAYLEAAGYTVVERNYRTRIGEIDIIARDGDTLVFVEVKSWRTFGYDEVEHALDHRKQRRIVQASRSYLARAREIDRRVRYDVLFLGGAESEVRHVKDAFAVQS